MPLAKLLRLDPGRGDFLTVAGTGWRPGVVGVCRLGPGRESPAGFCIETGEAVVSNRLEQERRFAVPPVLAEHGERSAVNVPVARDQLLEAAQRVMTIGAVHERLYQGGSVQEADAAAYLEGLVADLRRSMSGAAAGRAVELDVPPPPLRLPADQLTPLGLVAAELVTNALKYGRGRVRLAVRPVPGVPGCVEVACEDEGPGFPEDLRPAPQPGPGHAPGRGAGQGRGPDPRGPRGIARPHRGHDHAGLSAVVGATGGNLGQAATLPVLPCPEPRPRRHARPSLPGAATGRGRGAHTLDRGHDAGGPRLRGG